MAAARMANTPQILAISTQAHAATAVPGGPLGGDAGTLAA